MGGCGWQSAAPDRDAEIRHGAVRAAPEVPGGRGCSGRCCCPGGNGEPEALPRRLSREMKRREAGASPRAARTTPRGQSADRRGTVAPDRRRLRPGGGAHVPATPRTVLRRWTCAVPCRAPARAPGADVGVGPPGRGPQPGQRQVRGGAAARQRGGVRQGHDEPAAVHRGAVPLRAGQPYGAGPPAAGSTGSDWGV